MPNDITADLRKNHKIDEYFYPDISMNIDLPQGFKGEVSNITEILEKNGFAITSENVFQVMNLKKSLFVKYRDRAKGKKVVTEYDAMLRAKEPVGSVVPLEYFLVSGLVAVLLFGLARFTGSFADETGKLAARKLFGRGQVRKQLLKELNISADEYTLFNNEITVIIKEDSESIEAMRKNLKKRKEAE